MIKRTHQIILIDDEAPYIELAERAIKIINPACDLRVFRTGAEFLTWLAASRQPNLILLDINMPSLSGFDVLRTLKTTDKFKSIPVLMLSTSNYTNDVDESYSLGASGYLVKPDTFQGLLVLMKVVNQYWFDISRTPNDDWSTSRYD